MTEHGDRNGKDPVVVTLDWEAKGLAMVRQAAALAGRSFEGFIRLAAEAEAARVLKERKGLMDLTSAAEFLGTSRGEVVELISNGKLRAKKVDGEWLVEQESARDVSAAEGKVSLDQIELDLRELVDTAGLAGLTTEGEAPLTLTATWCFVTQEGVLVCPRAAWPKLGRDGVASAANDAVRRFIRRRDRESGRI